jgi:hypothetical protein
MGIKSRQNTDFPKKEKQEKKKRNTHPNPSPSPSPFHRSFEIEQTKILFTFGQARPGEQSIQPNSRIKDPFAM